MTDWTTPRTANVDDDFTSSWYNTELRDNLIWAHDLLISAGSTFPSGPLTGQRHLFVSGTKRMLFAYDGTNWLSDERVGTVLEGAPGAGTSVPYTSATVVSSSRPTVDVAEQFAAGMTLQGRFTGVLSCAPNIPHAGLTYATYAAAGSDPGTETIVAGTQVDATGWQAGPWVDLISGSFVAVQIGLYGYYTAGGSPDNRVIKAYAGLRFKK